MIPPGSSNSVQPGAGISRRSLLAAAGVAAIGADFVVSTGIAFARTDYLRPCGDVPISDSWQGHRNRRPPSAEPGTDYAVARGTPVLAATNGTIVDVKRTNTTAAGRFVALRGDDGNYVRYLHLDGIASVIGARVSRGEIIALSGASGLGSDQYYGPHVHVSLWIGTTPAQAGFENTVDFEDYVQSLAPDPDVVRRNNNMSSLFHIANADGSHTWALAGDGPGSAAWIEITNRELANALSLQHGRAATVDWTTWKKFRAAYTSGP